MVRQMPAWTPKNSVSLPIGFPLRAHFFGNGIEQTIEHGRWLKALGIDFLHIDSGPTRTSPSAFARGSIGPTPVYLL